MKIVFIGGGNMATALIGGLIQQGWPAAALRVVEIDPQAREALEMRFGIGTSAQVGALDDEEVAVLAVKPQQLHQAASALRAELHGQLVVTIAAGVRTVDLSRWLGGHRRIVRVMPNTPALIGAGVAALYGMPGVSEQDRAGAQSILAAVGATLWVEREDLMDAVTAVSGSGPAYVFYFMEAVMQAAQDLGLEPEQARLLTLETFYGAARLARESSESPATLRARVTSKGGTTERALRCMQDDRVSARVTHAVHEAAGRSRELGDELSEPAT